MGNRCQVDGGLAGWASRLGEKVQGDTAQGRQGAYETQWCLASPPWAGAYGGSPPELFLYEVELGSGCAPGTHKNKEDPVRPTELLRMSTLPTGLCGPDQDAGGEEVTSWVGRGNGSGGLPGGSDLTR